MTRSSQRSFKKPDDNDTPNQGGQYTESPDETFPESDQPSPVDRLPDNSNEELSPPEDESDALDVDEHKCQTALLMYLQGLTQKDIAIRLNRSERTIRRWIKTAKENGIGRVDTLNPSEELSYILTMLDTHRRDLIKVKDCAASMEDGALQLRCLRELVALEERRLNIYRKVGLFVGYKPKGAPDIFAEMFGGLSGTKVEGEDDYEEGDDYEEEDYEEEDEDDQDEA